MGLRPDTGSPDGLADLLEVLAIDRSTCSVEEMADYLVASETVADDDVDIANERREQARQLADGAFDVAAQRTLVNDRSRVAPGTAFDGYPFQLDYNGYRLVHVRSSDSAYEFLLALSLSYEGPRRPITNHDRKLFEEVCARAAHA